MRATPGHARLEWDLGAQPEVGGIPLAAQECDVGKKVPCVDNVAVGAGLEMEAVEGGAQYSDTQAVDDAMGRSRLELGEVVVEGRARSWCAWICDVRDCARVVHSRVGRVIGRCLEKWD